LQAELKIEATCSSETSVEFQLTKGWYIPEYSIFFSPLLLVICVIYLPSAFLFACSLSALTLQHASTVQPFSRASARFICHPNLKKHECYTEPSTHQILSSSFVSTSLAPLLREYNWFILWKSDLCAVLPRCLAIA
jgi:hypothetical protein